MDYEALPMSATPGNHLIGTGFGTSIAGTVRQYEDHLVADFTTTNAVVFCQDFNALKATGDDEIQYQDVPAMFGARVAPDILNNDAVPCLGTAHVYWDIPMDDDLPDFCEIDQNPDDYDGAIVHFDFHADCGGEHLHIIQHYTIIDDTKFFDTESIIIEPSTGGGSMDPHPNHI